MMRQIRTLLLTAILLSLSALGARAQYFESIPEHTKRIILKAANHDSIIVERMTPFDLPAVNDSMQLFYHEPMPDSIMPKSAIVIGRVTIQSEEADGITTAVEKIARRSGADWIVSFEEPRSRLAKDG